VVVHSGDYKIDHSPIDGEPFDLYSFSRLGEEGVLALVADSTNANVPGSSHTERWVERHPIDIAPARRAPHSGQPSVSVFVHSEDSRRRHRSRAAAL